MGDASSVAVAFRYPGPDSLERLRDDVIPAGVSGSELEPKLTGVTAANIDFTSFLAGRIVVFFGVVLLLSFLLLMAVFRSLMVPLKAVIMNMLSIGAAYGLIVMIFSWGWGASLFETSGNAIRYAAAEARPPKRAKLAPSPNSARAGVPSPIGLRGSGTSCHPR